MPSLPPSKRRPWQPAPAKREYAPHAARDSRYDTAAWQRVRAAHKAKHPLCACCKAQGRTVAATVVDHITPVRLGGDFWDTNNHQSLCTPCHQAKSASERLKQPQGVGGQNP
jgi:5-methylcytosine-specific restriction endonuclease McrA